MSDVVATYGLDYGDYKKGIADIDRLSSKHFQKQQQVSTAAMNTIGTAAKAFVGGNILGKSIQLSTAAINEFAERSPEAARALDSIRQAGSDAAASLGSDLFHALGLANGGWEGFIKGANDARESVVDFLASGYRELFGDSSVEDLNKARAADLDSQLFSKFQKEDAVRRLETEAGIAEAGGNSESAATLREQARNKRALMEIGAIKYAPERDARKEQEEKIHNANMARIKREADARADAEGKRASAEQRRMAMEEELSNLEAKALNIQTLRAQGLDDEADTQEVILEYARNAARIRGDGSLTDDDRRNKLSTNDARRAQALDNLTLARNRKAAEDAAGAVVEKVTEEKLSEIGIRANVSGPASIESGLGGRSGLRTQVFGPGGGGDGSDPIVKEQKRQTALMERIERNTAGNRQAVFG